MKHEKTFEAIDKLREIEIELHRLKNALEMANKALDAKSEWVGLTDEEVEASKPPLSNDAVVWELAVEWAEAKLKEKNT